MILCLLAHCCFEGKKSSDLAAAATALQPTTVAAKLFNGTSLVKNSPKISTTLSSTVRIPVCSELPCADAATLPFYPKFLQKNAFSQIQPEARSNCQTLPRLYGGCRHLYFGLV
jgi:hypothetical protein